MKRIFSLVLTSILLLSISSAFAQDCSSLTDAELKEQFYLIRNELSNRGLKAENKTVLLDQNGVTIYLDGSPYIGTNWTPTQFVIPVIIVNNTDKNIYISIQKSSLNGWAVTASAHLTTVPNGKKAKVQFIFKLSDSDIETIDDFDDVEFTLTIIDTDNYSVDVVPETDLITIYPTK